jgi:hypothetical protein
MQSGKKTGQTSSFTGSRPFKFPGFQSDKSSNRLRACLKTLDRRRRFGSRSGFLDRLSVSRRGKDPYWFITHGER